MYEALPRYTKSLGTRATYTQDNSLLQPLPQTSTTTICTWVMKALFPHFIFYSKKDLLLRKS